MANNTLQTKLKTIAITKKIYSEMLKIKNNPLPRNPLMYKMLKIINSCTNTIHIEEAMRIIEITSFGEEDKCTLTGALILRIHQLNELAWKNYRLTNRFPCTDEQEN